MKVDDAVEYAEKLGLLKPPPFTSEAQLIALAELIAEICADASEAGWLVREMLRRYDGWPGPLTFRSVHQERYGRYDARDTPPSVEWKTERTCDRCSDIGLFRNRFKRYQRCPCPAGVYATDEMIADYNRRLTPQRLVSVKEIKNEKHDPEIPAGRDEGTVPGDET